MASSVLAGCFAFVFANQLFDFIEFGCVDFATLQQMADGVGQTAAKNAINEVPGYTAGNVAGFDAGGIQEPPTLGNVAHQTAGFQSAQHRRDGRVSKISAFDCLLNFGHGNRFAAFPNHLHDLKLQVTEPNALFFVPWLASLSTTAVILPK